MVAGAQTSCASYTGLLLLQFISAVICCSLHVAPSVLQQHGSRIQPAVLGLRASGGGSSCGDIPLLRRACPPWEESLAKRPLTQGLLWLGMSWEARCGCIFFTDNPVCSCTSLSSYVLAQTTAERSITYFEVTPCRWKHLALWGLNMHHRDKEKPGRGNPSDLETPCVPLERWENQKCALFCQCFRDTI